MRTGSIRATLKFEEEEKKMAEEVNRNAAAGF